MKNEPVNDTLGFLPAVMARCGAQGSPEHFHAAVNVAFHEEESEVYDQIHKDMWTSLPPLFTLFAEDFLRAGAVPPELSMLDIGCGTGLASTSILQSPLGGRVGSIDLLDTSPSMLARARKRAEGWKVPVRCFEGQIEALPPGERYHLIVTCSVLHHVPDLRGFMDAVAARQAAGGLFLHLQDPNGDAASDPELQRRMSLVARKPLPEWLARLSPRRVIGRLFREITAQQGRDYISATNRRLLSTGVIERPLTASELFSITDIHVHDRQGISVPQIQSWLRRYELISKRSYGFFGVLRISLPARLQKEEDRLLAQGALNGFHIGAAWKAT